MSYLTLNEDFKTVIYNLLTRGITLGLGSDYLRSFRALSNIDIITYNQFGFMNEYGCFSPDAGRFFKLFSPKNSFYQKTFRYI